MTEFQIDVSQVDDIDRPATRHRIIDPTHPDEVPLPPDHWPPTRLPEPRTENPQIRVYPLPQNGAPEVPEARKDWPFGFTTRPVAASVGDRSRHGAGPRIGFGRAEDERVRQDQEPGPELPGA